MFVRSIVAALVACLLLGSCGADLALELQADEPVRIVELPGGTEHLLSSAARAKFGLWIANQRTGWAPYPATNPARGIYVRAGQLDVQFVDGTAIAHTREGFFVKAVQPADYAFLR